MSQSNRSAAVSSSRGSKSVRAISISARVVAELLEQRTLLSATLSGTTLNVTGTSGADAFTLSDSGTTITVKQGASTFTFADSAVSQVVINPTAGGDTVSLLSNTKPVTITGGGLDTVNIGNGGSTSSIKAAVSVGNNGSHTALAIDGSQDTSPAAANPAISSSSITGISIGAVSYTAAQLNSLNVMTQYDFTVTSTGVLGLSGHTVVTNASENGNVTVVATTGPLDVNSTNTQVGTGNTQGIQGNVITNSDGSAFGSEGVLTIDDSADTVGRTVTIGQTGYLPVTGAAPALIQAIGGTTAFINVETGSGNDTFLLYGLAAHESNINGGDGNNTFISEPGNEVSGFGTTIAGGSGNDSFIFHGIDFDGFSLLYDGGGGTNTFTFDDSTDTQDQSLGISDTGFGGAGGAINFNNITQGSILAGSGNDNIGVDSTSTIATTIHGGAGNDSITGGAGNDSLFGDDGNDSLDGGAGADILTGGTGIDTLDGGDGQPIQIIADNIASAPVSGSQGVTLTGNWIPSTSTPGFYATNYITDNNTLKGTKSATFTPNIPTAGSYQVFARWTTGPTRATNVPFTVLHQNVTTTVIENQQTNNNSWVSLGIFALNAGTTSNVTVTNDLTNGYVIADAVRFLAVPAAQSNVTLNGTTLNVTGTSAADATTLSDNGSAITVIFNGSTFTFPDSSVTKINVNPSAGGDTVNLLSNTKPVIISGGGLDTVNIGNSGSLAKISAAVTIGNSSSFTNLTVDGSADQPVGISGALSASALTGLSAGAINYAAARLSAFTINTSNGIMVNDTGVLHNTAPTVINGGSSGINATTGPLTVNLSNFGTEMFIGNGNMQSIKGQLNINSDPTFGIELHFDDSADPTGRNISVSGFLNFTGLSPAPIFTTGTESDSDLFLTAGTGDDTLTIAGGVFDTDNHYDLGAGNDTVNFLRGGIVTDINGENGNDTLNLIGDVSESLVHFDGGDDTNSVVLNESTVAGSSPYITPGGFFFGLGAAMFSSVQNLSIFGGTGNNTYTVDSSMNLPLLIHGGPGNDLIYGGTKNDSLFGDAGNDTIFGQAGDDSVFGGDGNDSLNGGQGNDIQTGGTGIDTIDSGEGDGVHIIADDIAAQGVTVTGNWISSTSTPGFYATDYLTDNNTLKGTKSVKWAPTLPAAGAYQVYAQWTSGTNRATNVPYDIVHQGTTTTVLENQQKNNGAWVLLGTFNFNAGAGASVTVRNTGTNGYVIADAVRFIPVVAAASITGAVFNDANGNGKQDPGEGGTNYFSTVYIDLNKDGVLDNNEPSTQPDQGGNWSFTNLAAGAYRIRKVNQAGINRTVPAAGFYDVTITTGAVSSDIYGKIFGDHQANPASVPFVAVNTGGPDLVLNSGDSFSADNHFTGGTAVSTAYDVANTDNDPLYYSYRSGASFTYSIPVPSGHYNLVLWFADPTKTAAGQRVFNVTAQGQQVLTNFDIVATGGAKTPVIKTIPITITQDVLTLSFSAVTDNAIISAFAIYPV